MTLSHGLLVAGLLTITAFAQTPDNLVVEGVPPFPPKLQEEVAPYFAARTARFQSWHPQRRELLMTTRFMPQLHVVNTGLGAIRQANLDGTNQRTLLSGQNRLGSPALDFANGWMYWNNALSGDIRRARLDGTEEAVLFTGQNDPHPVVLDSGRPHLLAQFWRWRHSPRER